MGLFKSIADKAKNEFVNPHSHLNRFFRKTFGSNSSTATRKPITGMKPLPKSSPTGSAGDSGKW